MLSWPFVLVAALLVLVPPILPGRARAWSTAALSIVGCALAWQVPVGVVLGASVAVYALGRALPGRSVAVRRWGLRVGVVAVVGWLVVDRLHDPAIRPLPTTLRVFGLSYFALKLIQHLVDASKGRGERIGFAEFVGAIFYLPTYPAGPIMRTDAFADALAAPIPGWRERALGLERVVFGLGRKFLLADPLLGFAAPYLATPHTGSWLGLAAAVDAYALGLYLDFAGYSDIAIGIGRCAGMRVPENFANPYAQRDLTTLWQRWHMTLTGWLRDFVFVPTTRALLRMTRRPRASQVVGLVVTMGACGFWHGLDPHFLVWGLFHGVALSILAARGTRAAADAASPWRHAVGALVTFQVFALALVLFACDLRGAATIFARLAILIG